MSNETEVMLVDKIRVLTEENRLKWEFEYLVNLLEKGNEILRKLKEGDKVKFGDMEECLQLNRRGSTYVKSIIERRDDKRTIAIKELKSYFDEREK